MGCLAGEIAAFDSDMEEIGSDRNSAIHDSDSKLENAFNFDKCPSHKLLVLMQFRPAVKARARGPRA